MIRPLPAWAAFAALAGWLLATAATTTAAARAQDDAPAPRPDAATFGQFFTVEQPIQSDDVARLKAAARAVVDQNANQGRRPVLVFEIRPGATEFGVSYDLASFIAGRLTGAKTVAFVPEPLNGYGALVALACDEIVLGPAAAIGPITPEDEEVDRGLVEPVRRLAQRKGRDPELAIGMLDREADLRRVKTADGQTRYVTAAGLAALREQAEIVEDRPAWDAGARGVVQAERARAEGLARLLASDRADLARAYNLSGTANDPTLGGEVVPLWIRLNGPIDSGADSYVRRRLAQAREQGVNLIILQIDSPGGQDEPADRMAEALSALEGAKTVAYIDDRALGVAALLALGCDEIVLRRGARLGDVSKLLVGRDGRGEELDDRQREALIARAEALAVKNGYPPAVARALIDPNAAVIEARDNQTGAAALLSEAELAAEPDRFARQGVRKEPGEVLTVTSEDAASYGLAAHVVDDDDGLKQLYGLAGVNVPVAGPTWVDALVSTLNTPWASGLLLFVGLFMLVLELKLPGIGLPAITSALAFLLFFWSRYLSGTADQLEILLFLVGLICLALELFVFPGFGIFGMSGILLVLLSVVMASHTFVVPTEEYQYRQLGQTLLQLVLTIVAVIVGAVVFGRYFPSLPLFNRMVLKPESAEEAAIDPGAKPVADADHPLAFLLGEIGRTTTVLRPSGKARFGDLLVDVAAAGAYIEPDSFVEVVEVRGARVLVRRASGGLPEARGLEEEWDESAGI